MTGVPEFALDEQKEEHTKLARAVARVAAHYDIPALDPVTHDWIMLFKCLLLIYGTRLLAYQMRTRAESARNITPKPGLAQPAPPPPPAPAPQAPQGQAAPQQPIPTGTRAPVAPANNVLRAAAIPGFPNAPPLDIDITKH